MGGMGPGPLPSRDVKALGFTLFCAGGLIGFVVVRFVLHAAVLPHEDADCQREELVLSP
jgi:hypothetical protein